MTFLFENVGKAEEGNKMANNVLKNLIKKNVDRLKTRLQNSESLKFTRKLKDKLETNFNKDLFLTHDIKNSKCHLGYVT